ncbi:uncharacterized protein ACB057_008268 [Neosynchiropus ocellatus]
MRSLARQVSAGERRTSSVSGSRPPRAMCLLLLLLPALLLGALHLFREVFVKGKRCTSGARLRGKTVIVTGSNTGIGKTTAIDLAKRGARVILACRSKQRGEAALLDVRRESGSSDVVFMQLDLGSLQSVRSFAENFLRAEARLDILINNAGVYMQGRTQDGFGMMFGVNHLGHFLLTNLLLDRLKQCKPSRVVNLSSLAHNFGKIDFDCLNKHQALGLGSSFGQVLQVYSDSKLCNVLFTHELAKRLKDSGVTCYSLHPGAINSELARNTSSTLLLFLSPVTTFFFKNTDQGCQTTLHCALQEGLEPLTGRYFSNCTVREVYAKAKDDAAAKKLWELSERMSGLWLLKTGVAIYLVVYYGVFRGTRCLSPTQLSGKTAVVTGGNTGIGKTTALGLARRGARVILACRNKEKAEAAAFDIRRESGNNQVLFIQLDLASVASIRTFVDTFLESEPRLDILINNAGVMGCGRTVDGFDLTLGVNHLGHFLLTNLLLDRLHQCRPSRVVTVSALLHRFGAVDFSSLTAHRDAACVQSTWRMIQAYCNSKLCNVLFTRELANRLDGSSVTCYCLHPGLIDTELCRRMSWWQLLLLQPIAKLLFLDPESGCQTTLHCALQEGLEPLSGRYFSNCTHQQVGAKGRDDALAKKLWEVSERLVGLTRAPSAPASRLVSS